MNILKEINGLLSAGIEKIKSTKYDTDDEALYSVLNGKYSDAWNQFKQGNFIFRGKSFSGYVVEQIPALRISQNTSNVYTRLFSDILPSWSEYPKRNKSFICTNDFNKARAYSKSGYGSVYWVLPENNSKIGVCIKGDIWDSFVTMKKKGLDMGDFNDKFLNFLSEVIPDVDFPALFIDGSKDEILNVFNNIENEIKTNKREYKDNYYYQTDFIFNDLTNYIISNKKIIDFLDELLEPKQNGFSFQNSLDGLIKRTPYGGNEVWVEGSCLLITCLAPNERNLVEYFNNKIRENPKSEEMYSILIEQLRKNKYEML